MAIRTVELWTSAALAAVLLVGAGHAQPLAGGPVGNVYETNGWGDLTISAWTDGRFQARYTYDGGGTIDAQRRGNTIDGVWSQASSAQRCDTSVNGSFYHGRMTFTFDATLGAFQGVWGYCDETPYASWDGTLTRRGRVAQSTRPSGVAPVTTARRPSGAPVAAGATAQGAEQAYVYATTLNSGAKPTLTLSGFGQNVTGTYVATQGDATYDAVYQGGGGTMTEGRLQGSFRGNTFTGYWFEDQGRTAVQRECDPPRDGILVHGRVTLTFSADRRSFTGKTSTCDGDPADSFNSWRGTLTGRVLPF